MLVEEFYQELEKIDCMAIISEEDWRTISTVYQSHPSIPEVGGKKVIAELFHRFGMVLITDMLPRAKSVEELERRVQAARLHLESLQEQLRQAQE